MVNHNCIVIPVHIQKANWLISFLSSLNGKEHNDTFDIILGASNEHECRLFSRLVPKIAPRLNIKYVNISSIIVNHLKSEQLLEI